VEVCHAEARQIIGREMTVEEVVGEVERDTAFYEQSGGGVTFSGGEPLLQPEFLMEALRTCKEKGIHTVVDTCGHAAWNTLDGMRPYVDLFLYDLRLMDEDRHKKLTGGSNVPILRNLTLLSRGEDDIVLRVPIIPGVNDDDTNLRQMAGFAVGLPSLGEVNLLAYHRTGMEKYERLGREYDLCEAEPPSEERMAEMAQFFGSAGLCVRAGGVVDGD
jgi:pyruvate formate lyase activating enzyme